MPFPTDSPGLLAAGMVVVLGGGFWLPFWAVKFNLEKKGV